MVFLTVTKGMHQGSVFGLKRFSIATSNVSKNVSVSDSALHLYDGDTFFYYKANTAALVFDGLHFTLVRHIFHPQLEVDFEESILFLQIHVTLLAKDFCLVINILTF